MLNPKALTIQTGSKYKCNEVSWLLDRGFLILCGPSTPHSSTWTLWAYKSAPRPETLNTLHLRPSVLSFGAPQRTPKRRPRTGALHILHDPYTRRFRRTWTPKVCKIMAFWAIFNGFGPLFYILWGSRYLLAPRRSKS